MITGERWKRKKEGKYPAEPVTGSNHTKTQATSNTTKMDATISKNDERKQARRYNIHKSQVARCSSYFAIMSWICDNKAQAQNDATISRWTCDW